MKLWFIKKGSKPGDNLSGLQKDIKSKISKLPGIPKNINLKWPSNIDLKYFSDLFVKSLKQLSGSKTDQLKPTALMKFPYMFSAKLAQFPYRFYWERNWISRYYPLGIAVCVPIFWYIGRISNSEENKATWKAIRKHEKDEYLYKFD